MPGRWREARPLRTSRITARGTVMLGVSLVAFGLAYLLGWPELLVLGCFSGAPPVLALLFFGGRRLRLSVNRPVRPLTISLGDTLTLRARLSNLARSAIPAAEWFDRLPWSPGRTEPAALPPLPSGRRAGASVPVGYQVQPPRRGVADIGPLTITVGDPFGLVERTVIVPGQQRLVVAPRVVPLPAEAVRVALGAGQLQHFSSPSPSGDDDVMTRAYRPGDALRRVHWRTSARQGELMVRESEQPRRTEVVLVLETRRLGYGDVAPGDHPEQPESGSFEWALQMTASLGCLLDSLGVPLRVVETASPQLRGTGSGEMFLEELARMRLDPSEAAGFERASSAIGSTAEHAFLVAVLGEPDAGTVRRLVESGSSCDRAVAFLLAPPTSAAVALLRSADWTCLTVDPHDSVADAWSAVAGADFHAVA